jgi:hypothetical protein
VQEFHKNIVLIIGCNFKNNNGNIMVKKYQKPVVLLILATSIVIILTNLQIPYKIKTMAKVLPLRQWILTRNASGDILTYSSNNLEGVNNSFKLTSFERGESMILEFTSKCNNGELVNEGDTLGIIYSNKKQEKLVQLNGELDVLKATLGANVSGDKATEIMEAEKRVELARSEYEKQFRIVNRSKKLFEKELIAEEDYQSAVDELNILDKSILVKQAELETCLSGVKDEEVKLLQEKILAINGEVSFLKKEIYAQSSILAPFSGRLEKSFSSDTLLVLSNFEIGIALIPIAVEDENYLEEGDNVEFNLSNSSETMSGSVQMKQPTMKIINGRQCIMVLATVNNLSNKFISGIIARAEIDCGDIPFITFTERTILN